MIKKLLLFALLLSILQPINSLAKSEPEMVEATKKQFVYLLKLRPDFKVEKNWTPEVNQIVGKHFNHLKDLTNKGTVILAGRSDYDVSNENVFGIVVFEAESKEEATRLMNSDPAIVKIMTAELHPFSVALMRK